MVRANRLGWNTHTHTCFQIIRINARQLFLFRNIQFHLHEREKPISKLFVDTLCAWRANEDGILGYLIQSNGIIVQFSLK